MVLNGKLTITDTPNAFSASAEPCLQQTIGFSRRTRTRLVGLSHEPMLSKCSAEAYGATILYGVGGVHGGGLDRDRERRDGPRAVECGSSGGPDAGVSVCVRPDAGERSIQPMPGWERGTAERAKRTRRSRCRGPRSTSTGRPSTISVEIMDSCRNPDVLLMLNGIARSSCPPASSGTDRAPYHRQRIPRLRGMDRSAPGNGEVHVLVAGRFMVKVTAGTPSTCRRWRTRRA